MARPAEERASGGYDAVTLRVASHDEDFATAELWSQGSVGLEARQVGDATLLIAYFARGRLGATAWRPGSPAPIAPRAQVVALETLEDRDWLEVYRLQARPFAVGRRFWVDPRDPHSQSSVSAPPEGRIPLRLPARQAFGTGSHQSTRLALELLEEENLAGRKVLDLGCGSGVLSFAALALGAASVVGVELDPVAALVAAQNQVLNGTRFPLIAGRLEALDARARFDLAVANVIPEHLEADLGALAGRLEPGGRVIFSGFLVDRGKPFQRRLRAFDLRSRVERTLDEWGALVMSLPGREGTP